MIKTPRNIRCIWDGTLKGLMLTHEKAATDKQGRTPMKVLAIHGWLDNLNSMLPLAENLINRRPNYEIYVYDRAGHGFSSHIPRGFDYTASHDLLDIRTILQTLGWNKEKIIIIGHSYGATLGTYYATGYPDDVLCLVALDCLPQTNVPQDQYVNIVCTRIDNRREVYNASSKSSDIDLTMPFVIELTKQTRPGLTDAAAKLLAARVVRPDEENNLHFASDEILKIMTPIIPTTDDMIRSINVSLKAFVLYIGVTNSPWPINLKAYELFQERNPSFEIILLDRPHHLHMTHTDEVVDRIEQYFDKYLT